MMIVIPDELKIVEWIGLDRMMMGLGLGLGLGLGSVRLLLLCLMSGLLRVGFGIRFVIEKEECFSHNILYEGDVVHASFVVIKADASWHDHVDDGIDLVIKGPDGGKVKELESSISDKYEFSAERKGIYHFCFTNKSPFQETVDFDLLVGHYNTYQQLAKTEHFNPIVEHISKLKEALYNIQFEQHWLEAQTDRQAFVNESIRQRAVYKAIIIESLAPFSFSSSNAFLNASSAPLEFETSSMLTPLNVVGDSSYNLPFLANFINVCIYHQHYSLEQVPVPFS